MEKKEKGSGSGFSFFLTMVFFSLVGVSIYFFSNGRAGIESLSDVSVWEFFILSLAAFRQTRLLVYDKVAQFIRDLWLDTKQVEEDGVAYVYRSKPKRGFRRLMADLFSCPWCIGVWATVSTVFIYFMWPVTWFFWLVLAIAGVSSLFQLTANLIGWRAEMGKLQVKNMENHDGGGC
jgi:uncharacterized membrane protein